MEKKKEICEQCGDPIKGIPAHYSMVEVCDRCFFHMRAEAREKRAEEKRAEERRALRRKKK